MNNLKGIVFFDVDGTIIDCNKGISDPTEKTKEAIEKLKNAGYLTVLATGRPKSFLTKGIKQLGLDGYITSNGTYIELKDEIIFNNEIEQNKIKEIVEFLRAHNIEFLLEGQNKSYMSDLTKDITKALIEGFNLPAENIIDGWEIKDVAASKIVIIDDGSDHFKNFLSKYESEFAFMRHPGKDSYDMYRKEFTKAYGIKYLVNKLGFDKEKTYAFGDGENDIEMFQMVKFGVAMGDSHENLIPHAYKKTDNVPNDGIYKALVNLKLIA